MGPSDFGFCLDQTAREGWDNTVATFGAELAHDPDGCFLATVGGIPAAMVTTTSYAVSGWIGNLIVAPEARGKGIGSLLMERAIAHLRNRNISTIRLEADPPGVRIYRRLGFRDEFESPRFRREGGSVAPSPNCAAARTDELAALTVFDAVRFGDDRSRLLALLWEHSLAVLRTPKRGALAGYLMLQPSSAGLRIGPWVADHGQAASDLLDAALAFARERTAILACPGPNQPVRELLRERGFLPTPSSLRMVRGPCLAGGNPECVYALANGAQG